MNTPPAINSLQSSIWLYSLWSQDWISNMQPGEWADKCLELISESDLIELRSMSVPITRRPAGVISSLRHYAVGYYNIPESVFDYALITFVERQLCRMKKILQHGQVGG